MFFEKKTKQICRFWRLMAAGLVLALLLPPGSALADIEYDDGATHTVSGDISDTNMTVGATPAGVGTTVDQSAYINTLSGTLTLGRDALSSGNYNLSGSGSLSADYINIGDSGTGTFSQDGGTNTVAVDLRLGFHDDGSGAYTLDGGSLSAGSEYVGFFGSGAFTQTGGTNTMPAGCKLYLGFAPGGSGEYNLQGGNLSASYEYVGYYGNGVFTQSGGANTISGNLEVASFAGTTGTYNLINGSLSATEEYIGGIGDGGTGAFNQSGGTNTIADVLWMSYGSGQSSTYNLSDGSLAVGGMELMGYAGSSTFNQSSGTHTVVSDLYVDVFGTGTYNLSDGILTVGGDEYLGYSGTGTFTQTGGSHTVTGGLSIGYANSGTYNLSSDGSLTAAYESIGTYGRGTFTQSGGTNLSLGLCLGEYADSSGTYTLTGGSLLAGYTIIGYEGSGTFNQSSGEHTVDNTVGTGMLSLGLEQTGNGTYNLNSGLLASFGESIGTEGRGTFNQTGGTHLSGVIYLGEYATGNGTYNLSNGSLQTYAEAIGYEGSGTFTQTGGTHTVSGDLTIGSSAGSTGTYELSGGSLEVDTVYLGDSGSGTFTQSGGTHTVTCQMILGNLAGSSGTYNLNGPGNLWAEAELIGGTGSGTFTQSGGTHTVDCTLALGFDPGGSGSYNLSGGSLSAYSQSIGYDGSGSFTQSGGTNNVYAYILGEDSSSSSGTYDLSSGSLMACYGFIGIEGSGTFTQTGGTHTIDDGIDSGELDLGLNAGSSGTYNLSGGSLSTAFEVVGGDGVGVFTQTGGTNTVHNSCGMGGLALGSCGTGTYNLSGGALATDGEYLGFGGLAIFTQSGGSHTTAEIYLADGGTAVYNLQGGSFTAGTVYLNPGGTFNQTGGTLNATIFNQQGGEVQGSLENRGTFNYDSGLFTGRLLNYGTVTLNADFTADDGLANYASFNIDAGRTVTLCGLGLDNQGTLVVNGTLDGTGILGGSAAFLNNTGGTLCGSGTILGNLDNRGTVNPGNSPGTLTITGDYTQTAGGALAVEIASATSYDVLNVSGTASLDGTLRPLLLSGYVPRNHQVFANVLTAGSVTGTFSTVANFTPTLVGQARYSATGVDLLVVRDYTNSYLHLTHNQRAVANMLNGLADGAAGDLENVLHNLDSLTDPGAVADAYQQISADKAASLANLGFAGANLLRLGLANRITTLRYGGMGGGGLGGLGSFNLNYSKASGLMLAYNSSSLTGLLTAKKKAAPETRWGLYLDPGLVLGSQKTTINQTGYNFTIAGFTAGADYRLQDDLLIGLATGYSHTGASFRGSGGSVENNTWPLTAYAAYLPESFYAYGSLGYALNLFSLERQLSIGDLSRQATSSPTGHQFNAYAEAGYDVQARSLVVTPLVSLSYSSIWVNGFTESGAGSLNLEVASQQADSLQTGVGAKIAAPLKRNGVTVVPQVYATYQHEFTNNSRGLDARLSQGGSTFVFQTEQLGRDFAVLGANATILTPKNFSLQLNYNAEVGRANYSAHNINAGLRLEF